MNPFLAKPLRKVQPGNAPLKNSSAEHRPSRFLNMPKKINQDKKGPDLQKNKNPSPRKQNTNTNNINLIAKVSNEDDKKNSNIKSEKPNEIEQKVNNAQKVNNFQKENTLPQKLNNGQKISNFQKEHTLQKMSNKNVDKINKNQEKKEEKNENIDKNIDSNLIIDNNISISLGRLESNKLVFNDNDEILVYLRNQIKDGKIKDIKSKLEMKTNDFTGFTLSKKKQGYTIYEIELEEDIDKLNETFKNQRVEIGKKPIQIVFAEEQIKPLKKELDKKKDVENKKPDTLIQTMKNRTMEKEMVKVKKDVINDEIKNLQNKIQKQKVDLKNAENENDYIRKEIEKKSNIKTSKLPYKEEPKRRDSGLKVKIKDENDQSNASNNTNDKIEQKRTIEENQRKATRALARFKKVYSSHKAKDEGENTGGKPPENTNKIQSIAAILQEHIIKPLAEMRAENNDMRPRGGSVECRMIKNEGMAELLENAPVQRKKKPKITAFE